MNGRKQLLVVGMWIAAGMAGCSSQQADQVASPETVMTEFLEAVRVGDVNKAEALLTGVARTKTAELDMAIAPPGSETASFSVQGCELTGSSAQVSTEWTDLDTDGRRHSDSIVWLLRKEPEGWRITGMTTQVFADRDPVVLNFEEPSDMLAKQQEVEQELARRERQQMPPTPQAKAPSDLSDGITR